MNQIIGREKEQALLREQMNSKKSEFVAVYGRRRVGKTFLVREFFNNEFTFYLTGTAKVGTNLQLLQFHKRMVRHFPDQGILHLATNWFEAFEQLSQCIEQQTGKERKVIFLDELPWLDTRRSDFLPGLEYFWNSWASARKDILLIVCGSAASWMVKNLLRSRGGLHNRVTERIKLDPFNLFETELLIKSKNLTYSREQIILLYMAFGGIPYYLDRIKPGLSAPQNINKLCFEKNAPFRLEYQDLYSSLFLKAERH
jgi:AAA+ ATPase superfamily predicted ATPase